MNLTSVSSPLNGVDYNSILTPHTRSGKREISPISCPPGLLPAHWDALRTTGSGWDVAPPCPDAPLPRHLAEWVEGSAVAPELASANVVSLRGAPVLEALAGDQLARLGGHASQYATGEVTKILRPLEPLAEAGGWWCSGLDPKEDWRTPMEWGQFKPDAPRWDQERDRPRKYEHPGGAPARTFWLRVPAVVARLTADRFGLTLSTEAAADTSGEAGAYWRWWASEARLPLMIIEGPKKAAALLSAGVPAVALPGIWPGQTALAELLALPLKDRPVWVLFDDSSRENPDEPKAANRLGRELAKAGGRVLVGIVPGNRGKGADDHLAAGGSWEELAAALAPLAPPSARPVLPKLRAADVVAPSGVRLHDAAPIPCPEEGPLVAISAPMGAGKTYAIGQAIAPHLAAGTPVISLTHRVVLGEAESESWGLPWAAEPGTDARLQGLGMCVDSCCPTSRLKIRPEEFLGPDGRGPVLLGDEWGQDVEHMLFGTGTAVAKRRPAVLETVAALMRSSRQLILSESQLPEPVLRLGENLTGRRLLHIVSKHQPMAGRRLFSPQGLTAAEASERGRGKVLELIDGDSPFLVWTGAQGAGSRNSAQNLARLHRQRCPDNSILMVDAENPEAAEALMRAVAMDAKADALEAERKFEEAAACRLQGVGQWRAIYLSPVVTSGLSIDLRGHFGAVVVLGGGTIGPEHLAQAAARVRDPACPVFLYAPARSPGGALRIGSGDTNPADLLRHLGRCEARLLADLTAAGGWDPMGQNESPWLRCYLDMACLRNRQRLAYAATAAALLQREGWALETLPETTPETMATAMVASKELAAIAEVAQAEEDQAVIAAELPTQQEAEALERKRRKTPAERARQARHHLARRWGLGSDPPSLALLDSDRKELSQRARFGWILQSIEGRQLAAFHDVLRREQLVLDGKAWGPDLVRELLGHRIAAADGLGLPSWLERAETGEWFSAADSKLLALQATAEAHRGTLTTALGVTPGKRATTTLRALLALAGYELEAKRSRRPDGNCWRYRVRPAALPDGVDHERLLIAWRDQLKEPS